MTDFSVTPVKDVAVRGRYLGYPIESRQGSFTAYTLDGRRIIRSSASHAEVRAAVRAYRRGFRSAA